MKRLGWLMVLLLAAGCGPGVGTLSVTTWGEAYIEDGIPVDSAQVTGFVDGWTVKYERFLVVLGEFSLAKKTGEQGPKQQAAGIVNLVKPGPVELFSWKDVPAAKWDRVSYGIGPAKSSATGIGAIDASDVERMKTGGLAVYVEGSATKNGTSKRFAWGFANDTLYDECTNMDYGDGVTIPTGGQEVVQLTIHGDHFFYDDLESPEAKLRFQALADADADADGAITLDELAAVQLTSLPLGQYGTGSAGSVKSLKDFIGALVRTIGHYRGEGECVSKAR
ncbi:MAG: hypothetical protein AB1730_07095 [Myxococcota bacterium]